MQMGTKDRWPYPPQHKEPRKHDQISGLYMRLPGWASVLDSDIWMVVHSEQLLPTATQELSALIIAEVQSFPSLASHATQWF